MSILILAAMMMAQAPSAVQPPPEQPVKVKKHKPKQVCETVDVTGTRVPQRICRNADDAPPTDGDVTDSTFGLSKLNAAGAVRDGPN